MSREHPRQQLRDCANEDGHIQECYCGGTACPGWCHVVVSQRTQGAGVGHHCFPYDSGRKPHPVRTATFHPEAAGDVMPETDNDLIGDTDALHWARRFVLVHRNLLTGPERQDIGEDEETMTTWFAAAIESGRMAAAALACPACAAGDD